MKPKVVLAYSGGLDTTYCAIWLREQGYDVYTTAVQTGGFTEDELAACEERARGLGVAAHHTIDAVDELFSGYLKYLIFANAMRGEVYPLSVSAERIVQAERCADYAKSIGADALAHGSTGAGNDQIRFDVAFYVLAPELEILTPIRSQGLTREATTAYLESHGISIPAKTTTYSINRGLWGTTIGGGETHRSDGELPEEAYVLTPPRDKRPSDPEEISIEFECGVPVALSGKKMSPVQLIETLNAQAGRHGVGRGMHIGDTILGIKGRVAFEAPAAVVIIAAHRELEKLVLSRHQLMWKRTLGDLYGSFVHEARYFDPLMRDIEAFLESSQRRVSGRVRVRLFTGQAEVLGSTSPNSLMDAKAATYGESSSLWTGAEAAAFAKIYGMQDRLAAQAAGKGGAHAAADR